MPRAARVVKSITEKVSATKNFPSPSPISADEAVLDPKNNLLSKITEMIK